MKMDYQDLPDHRDRGVLKDHVGLSGRTLSRDHPARQDHPEDEDRMERMEDRDHLDQKDHQGHPDPLGHRCMHQPLELGLEPATRKGQPMTRLLPAVTHQRQKRKPLKF